MSGSRQGRLWSLAGPVAAVVCMFCCRSVAADPLPRTAFGYFAGLTAATDAQAMIKLSFVGRSSRVQPTVVLSVSGRNADVPRFWFFEDPAYDYTGDAAALNMVVLTSHQMASALS